MTAHFPRTRREVREGLIPSHALLERAGFIRQVAAGVYALLPLGWRVHQRICQIIFAEMERGGVQNVQLPILQPESLWQQSGRWAKYVQSGTMFVTTEQQSRQPYGLAPTAEEVVTALVAAELSGWRELPLHLHQIGPKFRDELRPRMGLLRGREFSMSDAYSFDPDEDGMRASFDMYRGIYRRIFEAVGLRSCIAVQADSGAIGGQGSSEFMAVCDVGEDELLTCDHCDYGANMERAASRYTRPSYSDERRTIRWVPTPGIRTVEELERHFADQGITAQHMVKTIICTVNPKGNDPYDIAVCIRGDLGINLVKVRNALGADEVVPALDPVVREVTGAEVGFAGPIGQRNVRILFDQSVCGMSNFLCGYNTTDHHALDVNFGGELPEPEHYYDLHNAAEGHGCPNCDEGRLGISRGIEVGHIFMLQQGYARALDVSFLDQSGEAQVPWMGCYGIGTTRLMQAIVEQNRDGQGICWPEAVAPYQAHILTANHEADVQRELADRLYEQLSARGIDVLYDDRGESAGVKFADADLIGCPRRITVGRLAAEGKVELRLRHTGEQQEFTCEEVLQLLSSIPTSC
ncbi:MAG: proline--tRNA ligase [Candidatus Nomurabacteria bacterium]|nr:MAG: proline--tRNA ligase [Candidatus Nomurabacteria bacterium]